MPKDLSLEAGESVIVETEKGIGLGKSPIASLMKRRSVSS